MNEPVYIVCGGPSLRDFDFSLLDNKRVVAINRAYEACPNADILYFTDMVVWTKWGGAMLEHGGRIIHGVPRSGARIPNERVEHWPFTGAKGLEMTPGRLRHGQNSGCAAVNLCVQLGYKRIYLLGCDMGYGGGDHSHWHDGYSRGLDMENEEWHYRKMVAGFAGLVAPLAEQGVVVFNANPDSRLECFPKITRDEALKDAATAEVPCTN